MFSLFSTWIIPTFILDQLREVMNMQRHNKGSLRLQQNNIGSFKKLIIHYK